MEQSSCYTDPVASKKGAAGIGVPNARRHTSRNRNACGFFFCGPSFGGPDGEPQGSPVSGLRRAPVRQPIRAAAQIGVWSAVVINARLEAIMAKIRMQPGLGLCIAIKPDHCRASWTGTRAEIEAERIVPANIEWPTDQRNYIRFDTKTCWFSLHLLADVGNFDGAEKLYRLDHRPLDMNVPRRRAMLKLQEAAKLLAVDSQQSIEQIKRHSAALGDRQFKGFKRVLLGQKQRGRPRTKFVRVPGDMEPNT